MAATPEDLTTPPGGRAAASARAGTTARDAQDAPALRAILFTAHAADRTLDIEAVDVSSLQADQLLWVDARAPTQPSLADVLARLGLPVELADELAGTGGTPLLRNHGDWFVAHAVAAHHAGGLVFEGRPLWVVGGRNVVLSVHATAIGVVDALVERERGDTALGVLSAESFVAALLDWHLSSYFDAVSDFEASVERLETRILEDRSHSCLPELQQLRRGASRLRRMLAPHRRLFAGLARPDFRPGQHDDSGRHFHALDVHFERAMDMVENARELVIGSFELFTSRTAQRTNDTMRRLTFVTVMLGVLGVSAGVLGMNFDAGLFDTGEQGFLIAVGAMAAFVLGAVALGRWRDWF